MCWTMNMDRHKKKWARSIFEDRRRTQFYKVYTCIFTRKTRLGPIYVWLLWKKTKWDTKLIKLHGMQSKLSFPIYPITSYMSQVDVDRCYIWWPICLFKISLNCQKVIKFMEHQAVATMLFAKVDKKNTLVSHSITWFFIIFWVNPFLLIFIPVQVCLI